MNADDYVLSDLDEYAAASPRADLTTRLRLLLGLVALSWGAVLFVAYVAREIGAAIVRGLS